MKRERGQSLVELAISLVVLLYLLSGAAEFGVLFFQFIQMRDAAQEGALYGSIYPNDAEPIIRRVYGSSDKPLALRQLYNAGELGITVTARDKDNSNPATNAKALAVACEGDGLEVVLTYRHDIFMPFMPRLLNQEYLELTATATDTILKTTPNPASACP